MYVRTSLWRGVTIVTIYFQTKDSNRLQQSWAGLSVLNEKSAEQLLTLGTVSSGKNGSADDDATADHTRGVFFGSKESADGATDEIT